MGSRTDIGWCDSTVNLAMGCDGCKLSARKGSGTCYAESLTDRHAGRSTGYPAAFYEPTLFTHRLDEALRWKDLTGTERPDKPWMNGRPRHIFHGDMGDYWTESLPLDWLAPHVQRMSDSPHISMFLTKRPSRARRSWKNYGAVPKNFILMASVTSQATVRRAAELCGIPDCMRGISAEPLIGPLEQDSAFKPGQQGRIPPDLWARKEMPELRS